MKKNHVPISLNLTSGLLVVNISTLIGMMGLPECKFHLALAKSFNQYAGHLHYVKIKKTRAQVVTDLVLRSVSHIMSIKQNHTLNLFIRPLRKD